VGSAQRLDEDERVELCRNCVGVDQAHWSPVPKVVFARIEPSLRGAKRRSNPGVEGRRRWLWIASLRSQ
jgi:hypothetical protein